jgi:P-type conjugative transfer protein TrbL
MALPLRRLGLALLLGLFLAFAPYVAPVEAGTLDGIRAQFDAQTIGWTARALDVARDIFVAIVGTELIWSLIEIFLGTRELEAFIASITRRIISVGAAVTVFTVAPTVINNVLFDFSSIGSYITGYGFNVESPDTVLHYGAVVASALNPPITVNVQLTLLSFVPSLIAEMMVQLAFAVAACALLLAWVEAYIVVSAGAFLLGFIGSRWTMPWAERYLGMVLAVATKLFVLSVILGLGAGLSDALVSQWGSQSTGHAISDYFTIAGTTVVFALVAWFAPGFVASLVGASPVLSTSSVVSAVRGAVSQIAGGVGAFGRAAESGSRDAVAAAAAIRPRPSP